MNVEGIIIIIITIAFYTGVTFGNFVANRKLDRLEAFLITRECKIMESK